MRVLHAWHFWKAHEPMEARNTMFGDPPVFRDDKWMLPLQAADLYAWHARKERELASEGKEYQHPGWKRLLARVKGVTRHWTALQLEDVSKNTNLIRDLYALGPWPYETNPRRPKRTRR
jgi:hypothetical protein